MAKRDKPLPEITRARLNAAQALTNLKWVEETLRGEWRGLDLAELPALKEYAAIQRWKIDKVLPTPKQVEISGKLEITSFRLKADPK